MILPGHRQRGCLRLAASLLLAVALASPARAQDSEPAASPAKTPPPEPRAAYMDLWDRGDYRKAFNALERELSRLRSIPATWAIDHAQMRFDLGDADAAIEEMEGILRQIPRDPEYLLRLANYYRARGRKEDWLATLEQVRDRYKASRPGTLSAPNAVAYAKVLAELGEDPKKLLSSNYATLTEENPQFVPGFVGAGDLAYEKADYKLAAEYYDKALKLDPKNVPALCGLAECYWKSGDSRLEKALKQVEEINPRHPRIRAIRAEILLDEGKPDAALQIIEMGLSVNTQDARFFALKAAALFLKNDPAEMAKVQQAALRINPLCSEVYRVPGRIASRHYRFAEGAALQRQAMKVDVGDARAMGLLALDLLRLGEEEEGRRILREAADADRYNVELYNMDKAMGAMDAYAKVERGPFILSLPKGEAPFLAEDALALLAEEIEIYQKKYDVQLETPIRVQIFGNHDDFIVRSTGLPGGVGYLGICFGRLVTMDSPSARSKGTINWRAVLWHEFVHVITLQKTKNRMPRWLSEGISVYEETRRSPAWGQRLEPAYKAILSSEPAPGLSDLEGFFTHAKSPNHLMLGYFLAGEFARFYIEKYGQDAMNSALSAIAEGEETLAALARGCGKEVAGIDADFKEVLKARLAPLANLPAIAEPAEVAPGMVANGTTMTLERAGLGPEASPFTDAMGRAREAMDKGDWAAAERELKAAHDLFPDYQAGDSPLRQLAKVYEKTGDRKALEQALRQEIDACQNDISSCRKLGKLLSEQGRWGEEAETARWAMGIDPFDVPMRQALLEGELKSGKTEEALGELDRLATLDAPRADDYRIGRARALASLRRWEEAKRETILLLEAKPHFWKAQETLLEIIERGDKP